MRKLVPSMVLFLLQFSQERNIFLDVVPHTMDMFSMKCVVVVEDMIQLQTSKKMMRSREVAMKFTNVNNKDIIRNRSKC